MVVSGFREGRADSERVAIRMHEAEFAAVPGFVGRGPDDGHAVLDGEGVGFVNLVRGVEPPAHPDTACRVVVADGPRQGRAARALAIFAEEDFAIAASDGGEV